jgi:hypothetical protein
MNFEPGYTGDGFTHQEDEDRGDQEACDRAVEGANEANGTGAADPYDASTYTDEIGTVSNFQGNKVVNFAMGIGTAALVADALDIINPESSENENYARHLANLIRSKLK